MDWTERVPSLVVMGELDTMWGRLESKIESRGGSVETQIEPFGKLDEEARTMLPARCQRPALRFGPPRRER